MRSRQCIVVALDLSEYAEIVLEHAVDQAARHDAADLHFVTVLEDRKQKLEHVKALLAVTAYEGLEELRRGHTDWRARLHVRRGRPADEIACLAAEVAADLIVVGRFGIHDRSVADRLLEIAPCPTLVVGLAGKPVPAEPPCQECVEVRAASAGERWFCDAHADSERSRLTTLVPMSMYLTHGGPLW